MVSDDWIPEKNSEEIDRASEEEAVAAFLRDGASDADAEEDAAAEQTLETVFADDEASEAAKAEEEAAAKQTLDSVFPDKEPAEPVAAPKVRAPAEEEIPEVDAPEPMVDPDDGIERRWYAIHAHSGQEGNVQKSLTALNEQGDLAGLISYVLVPMEEVQEFKSGEKRLSKRKYFPGYVLVRLPLHPEHNPDLWHSIKNTPGVTGFIGSRTVPVPLEDSEVDGLLEEIRGERERPRPKVLFETGERVKIIDGPFSNFMGNIDEVNEERGRLKIMIEIFERLTSVEVEFWQVDKI